MPSTAQFTAIEALKRIGKAEGRGRDHALVVPTWKIPEDASGAVAYSKGALFLHTLRTALGDKEFFSRIARYTVANIGHRVSTRDLAAVMDREPLFQRWAFSNRAVATAEPLSVALSPELVVAQLDAGLYRATHTFPWATNASIVEVADGTLVVCDTLASPGAANLLLDWLDLRFGKRQVVAIDTQFHSDRIGGNAAFLARGIPVWAGDRTNALIASRSEATIDAKSKKAHQEIASVAADHVFPTSEGKTFDFGGEKVDVHFLGEGHSPDNVVVYFPNRHLLHAGCLTVPSGKLGNTSNANLSAWPKTLARLEALGATRVISGHREIDQAAEVFAQTQRTLSTFTRARAGTSK